MGNDQPLTPSGGRTDSSGATAPASNLKHTPGPWHAWDRGIGWEVHQGAECGMEKMPPARCESVNDGFRETFTEADARLIAAAPDLLVKLESSARGLRNLVEFGAILPNYRDEAIKYAESFEAVIDQARGIAKSDNDATPEPTK